MGDGAEVNTEGGQTSGDGNVTTEVETPAGTQVTETQTPDDGGSADGGE